MKQKAVEEAPAQFFANKSVIFTKYFVTLLYVVKMILASFEKAGRKMPSSGRTDFWGSLWNIRHIGRAVLHMWIRHDDSSAK